MDSNAIEEIANKLGVGTDYLLNHLSEFASKWAAMQIATSCVVCVITTIVFGRIGVFIRKRDEVVSRERRRLYQAVPTVHNDVGMWHHCDMCPDFLSESAIRIMTHVMSPEVAMVNDMLAMH